MFSTPIILKATVGEDTEVESPKWLANFQDNADGCGTNLIELLRLGFVDACVMRKAYWRLKFPENYGSAQSLSDAERTGATDIRLERIKRDAIIDWSRDEDGELQWAILLKEEKPRPAPEDERTKKIVTWTIVEQDKVREFAVDIQAFEKTGLLNPEQNVEPMVEQPHGLDALPLIELDTSEGLWIGNRLESPQLEHFRLTAANNWSMRRTAYSQLLFKVENPKEFRPATSGAGYYQVLGVKEDADWLSPGSDHMSVVADEIKSQKDEIFRLVTQMSLGVDNNAAAIGRSAESKLADAEAIQVVLRTYGERIRDAIRLILNLISKARGEAIKWQVEGLDRFDTLDPETLLELLKQALGIGIPSKKFEVEAKYRAAVALLPGIEKSVKDEIRREVEKGVAEEESADQELREIASGTRTGAQGRPEANRRNGSADPAVTSQAQQEGVG